jgi:soluble lytic murein transglycosylase-like protein
VPPRATDPLAIARERWLEGDAVGVVSALSPWLEARRPPWGRSRTSGHLLLGLAHVELENWNLASRHFYRVRRAGGPLAPYGAWNEARVDHLRGRHSVAIRECRAYREAWPDGPHADECLLLIGDAFAAAGHRGASVGSYKDYLEKHPDTPREEEIKLAIALAYAQTAPRSAVSMLHELALSHSFPSTDLAVQAALEELGEQGLDVSLPSDPTTRMRRAEALRRSGRYAEAWELFQQLAKESRPAPDAAPDAPLPPDKAVLANWVDQREERFAWGTRNYDVYAEALSEQYEAEPSGDLAWRIFRAWSREGRYDKAVEWGLKAEEAHATHYRWRTAKDDMAWATMHAGLYEDSAERWAALAKRGGDFGRKARFYSAFAALQAGDTETALTRFDDLLQYPRDWKAPALYWRGKARIAAGQTDEGAADLQAAREADRSGWYSLVQTPVPPDTARDHDTAWKIRDGRWHGPLVPELPSWQRPLAQLAPATGVFPGETPIVHGPGGTAPGLEAPPENTGWSKLAWTTVQQGSSTPVSLTVPAAVALSVPDASIPLPDGYQECRYWDPDDAAKGFYRFAEARKSTWPRLPAAYDLAAAGLYTDSARLMFDIYEEWRSALNAGTERTERQQQIAAMGLRLADWRPYLLFTRDHYHAARACHGLQKSAPDAEERTANLRLSYPVVAPNEIWRHSQSYDVDPFLIMGIMRQESTYRNAALSPVGAIGLIQVMPRTGARVAAMLGEHRYSPGDLEDPSTNLRYGIYYFSRLMERYEGSFPLAVGSYNGGPHNISRWYKAHEGKIPMDVFVEQIEYDETRDYVKRVSGHYARYIAVYEGEDAMVAVPPAPAGNHQDIIDF